MAGLRLLVWAESRVPIALSSARHGAPFVRSMTISFVFESRDEKSMFGKKQADKKATAEKERLTRLQKQACAPRA